MQAFDDCTTVASIFKLLDSFEGLLDRGVIATDLERKHLDLVRGYGQDLKEVADMFRETKDSPPLNKNAAPHSGRVTWVRGLKERVGGGFCFLYACFLVHCSWYHLGQVLKNMSFCNQCDLLFARSTCSWDVCYALCSSSSASCKIINSFLRVYCIVWCN